jgi:histidinol-phosphatase (PHP family)
VPHLANYHTHNRWCDGQGEIADVIEAAIAAGLAQVGITSHAPIPAIATYAVPPTTYAMPLANLLAYRQEVLRQRDRYRDRIDVLLGLELDALPDWRDHNQTAILAHGFDFTVGSVHYIRRPDGRLWPLDQSDAIFAQLLAEEYRGDIRPLSEDYYRAVAALADYPGVEIIGHLDRALIDDTLQTLAKTDRIIELSTGGWRLGLADPWPSTWIVRRCRELGLRMTLNSDSHHPSQIAYDYARARALLHHTGHHEIARFNPTTHTWEPTPLD